MRRDIQWPRILAEGTAIVLSILLAFSIDAWWADRKEADAEQRQLHSLLSEFREARHQLATQLEGLEVSLGGTLTIFELMGPNATDRTNSEFRAALRDSLDAGVTAPQQSALQDVLTFRSSIVSGDAELWLKLQIWPRILGEIEIDGQHLENNREKSFVDALIRLGVPALSVVGPQPGDPEQSGPIQLRPTKFNADLSVLLRDPGVETVFAMRAIRSQLLIRQHHDAIRFSEEVIGHLEAMF